MKIKKSLLKYVFPKAPIEARLAAIRGEKNLTPIDFITVLFILTHDTEAEVSKAAAAALKACPENLVMSALAGGLASEAVSFIAQNFSKSEKVLGLVALDDNLDNETLSVVAAAGPLSVLEILIECVTTLKKPGVLPALRGNPNASRELIARAEELSSATGDTGELSAGKVESHKPKKAKLQDDYFDEGGSTSLYQMIQSMTVGDKIKLALTGNKEARGTLLKQSNKVVSRSVVRNPRITEDEVVKITQTRSVADEILREIARNDEWLKSYPIKRGLAFNPKTPVQITLRLLAKLNVKDLATLSTSKGVPNVVAAAARKIVDRKKN